MSITNLTSRVPVGVITPSARFYVNEMFKKHLSPGVIQQDGKKTKEIEKNLKLFLL